MNVDLSDLDLAEKERRILESAVEIFSEKGFSASTTNQISKAANVAEGTIFKYFKTKKDILRAILIVTIDLLSKKIIVSSVKTILENKNQKSLEELLSDLLYDRINVINKTFPLIRIILIESCYHEDIRNAVNKNIISKIKTMSKELFDDMVRNGNIREDICFEAAFRNVIGNLGAYLIPRKLFSSNSNYQLDEKEITEMIDVIINGISKK